MGAVARVSAVAAASVVFLALVCTAKNGFVPRQKPFVPRPARCLALCTRSRGPIGAWTSSDDAMDRFVPRRHADWERSLDFSAGADDSAYAQRLRQVLDIERGSILFRGLRGAPPEKARGHAKVQRMGAFDLPGATGYGAGTSPADWGSNDSLAVWVPGNGIYARNMTTREVRRAPRLYLPEGAAESEKKYKINTEAFSFEKHHRKPRASPGQGGLRPPLQPPDP